MSETVTVSGAEDTITLTNSGAASGTISSVYPCTGVSNVSNVYATGAGIGYPWANGTGVATSIPAITTDPTSATLTVTGTAKFNDDIIVKGRSLSDALDRIEERLKIVPHIQFDEKLEEKWAALKEIGDQYRALQAEIKEGEKAWAILNR